MVQKMILKCEYIFAFSLLLQSLFPLYFKTISSILIFNFLVLCKHYLEGFRLPNIPMLLIQLVFFLTRSSILRLILTFFVFYLIKYFPTYKLPSAINKQKVGMRTLEIPGCSLIDVYYPTDEITKDVVSAPSKNHWKRVAELLRFTALTMKVTPLPDITYKIADASLERRTIGVNENARIINIINDNNDFPAVILSHGMSLNRRIYSSMIKEWVSSGYIVFSLDHEDVINLGLELWQDQPLFWKERNAQLQLRKRLYTQVIDYIYDPKNISKLFQNQDIKLNYKKIVYAGHSFGGAVAAEVAIEDKRKPAGVMVIDPWYQAADQNKLYTPVEVPILQFRTEEYDKTPATRDPQLKYAKANSEKGQILSGMIKGSSHISMTDLCYFIPREMVSWTILYGFDDIEDIMIGHVMLAKAFLEEVLKNEIEKKDIRSLTLNNYKSKLADVDKPDLLLVDN